MENTENRFSRTEALLGEQAMEKLKKARVAVFGIGGVGGHVVEALVRSGVGAVDIVDSDKVCLFLLIVGKGSGKVISIKLGGADKLAHILFDFINRQFIWQWNKVKAAICA